MWREREGAPLSLDTTALLHQYGTTCAASLQLLQALRSGTGARPRAQALDSLLRRLIANETWIGQWWGSEPLLLARAWETLGDPARALAAVQLGPQGMYVPPLLATALREEGRLSVLQGDTARAIRAYRRYLEFRRDAEPSMIPQRDSVLAALGKLQPHR